MAFSSIIIADLALCLLKTGSEGGPDFTICLILRCLLANFPLLEHEDLGASHFELTSKVLKWSDGLLNSVATYVEE